MSLRARRRQLQESRRGWVAPSRASALGKRWVGVTMAALLGVALLTACRLVGGGDVESEVRVGTGR